MDERDWLGGTDLDAMLKHVQKGSDRKLRLFQVACCRRIWEWIPAGACRDAVELAERYAEGAANDRQRTAAVRAIRIPPTNPDDLIEINARSSVLAALDRTTGSRSTVFLGSAVVLARAAGAGYPPEESLAPYQAAYRAGQQAERELLRCIFGNPFRPAVVEPHWPTWRDATIPRLAHTIAEQGSFEYLPVLGDALEEAGCEQAEVVNHCRTPGPHVRGCWVVDLLIGKD